MRQQPHDAEQRLGQQGFLTAEWIVGLSFLLIPAFILVFSLMQLPQRKNLTQVAAADAARAYVQTLDAIRAPDQADLAAAEAISAELGGDLPECTPAKILMIIRNAGGNCKGLKPGDVKVTSKPVIPGSPYCPGNEFTVTVSMPFPVTINPYEGGRWNLASQMISSSSTQRIDDYEEVEDPLGVCDPP